MIVKTFISRPLLSLVISVFIVLLGVISLLSLPVERYPDIAPPAIYVWASYPAVLAVAGMAMAIVAVTPPIVASTDKKIDAK